MTTATPQTASRQELPVSCEALVAAVAAVVATCRVQLELELEIDPAPGDPRRAELLCGSSIAIESATQGWQLAVMCNRAAGEGLTRSLLAMEEDEGPAAEDLADALGEIVRVAAGGVKADGAAAGGELGFGRPSFLDADGCGEFFTGGVNGLAQTLRGPGNFEAHVVLVDRRG